jgi:hypothetical protein
LEGASPSSGSIVLPNNQELYRKNGGGAVRNEGPAQTDNDEATGKDARSRGGERLVANVTLGPDEYTVAEYWLPRRGTVQLDLDASQPVATYIVGPKALERFEQGSSKFKYWGGFPSPRDSQHHTFVVPFRGEVFLIIVNPDPKRRVDIEYDMSF